MAEEIRIIQADQIADEVERLFGVSNRQLPKDVEAALTDAVKTETSPTAKRALDYLCENLKTANTLGIPVCQDTGAAVVFAEVGRFLHIEGGTLESAVNRGVSRAYREGLLRCSVVGDPLYRRVNTGDNTPAFVHIRFTEGDRLRLLCMPKGFGSENMCALRMMTPAASENDIVEFVCQAVRKAGANPCPPLVLGVGIGGTFDTVSQLAKEALIRPLDDENPSPDYAKLEKKILCAVNETGIGVQGFGGNHTALAVKIKTAPTHIAGLPVAVCFCCHVCRRAEAVI